MHELLQNLVVLAILLALWLLWRTLVYYLAKKEWRSNVLKWYSKPRANECPFNKPKFF
jgi:hypothetical protein